MRAHDGEAIVTTGVGKLPSEFQQPAPSPRARNPRTTCASRPPRPLDNQFLGPASSKKRADRESFIGPAQPVAICPETDVQLSDKGASVRAPTAPSVGYPKGPNS